MSSTSSDFEYSILKLAADEEIPDGIVSDGTIGPISVIRELFDGGYLTGHPIRVEGENKHFQFLAITSAGRNRLAEMQAKRDAKTVKAQSVQIVKFLLPALALALIGLLFAWLKKVLVDQ